MKLVIAEKPSFARNIIAALEKKGENFCKEDEYYKSSNYYVTSAFGHIMELYSFEKYPENEDKNMWEYSNLPFFHSSSDEYLFCVKDDAGAKKRFNSIKKLVNDFSVDEIIHCGDPDREGQLIVDLILNAIGTSKRVTRPLIKDMTDETINKAFENRCNNTDMVDVYNEGLARTLIDFDYGINLSRYVAGKTNAKPALNIGRVMGAIVNTIYVRDKSIEEFKPEKFYKIVGEKDFEDGVLKIKSKRKFAFDDKTGADAYASELSSNPVRVVDVEKKDHIVHPPKLFSQSTLQNKCNKVYKMAPSDTLEITQSLYEKGYTTYPRTNSEYLTENEKSTTKEILSIFMENFNNQLNFKENKRIFDESKVDGHTAIIPTGKGQASLSDAEKKVYDIIVTRFAAAFCAENCVEAETEIKLQVGNEEIVCKGVTQKLAGWRAIEVDEEHKDKTLPELSTGDSFDVTFNAEEDVTKPPKHYTVEKLNNYLKNPFKKDKDAEASESDDETGNDDEEYAAILSGVEIGTEATRAGIIEKAISKKYIELDKSNYKILDYGKYLIDVMNTLEIDMSKERTTDISKKIYDVRKGNRTIEDVLSDVHSDIQMIIQKNNPIEKQRSADNGKNVSIGKCPKCGADVVDIENPKLKAYKCSSCDFILWKNCFGGKINVNNAKSLISGDWTGMMKLKNKAGKDYTAALKLKDDYKSFELKFK